MSGDRTEAIERVRAWLDLYVEKYAYPKGTLDPEQIHGLGTDDGPFHLTVSDLRAVLDAADES